MKHLKELKGFIFVMLQLQQLIHGSHGSLVYLLEMFSYIPPLRFERNYHAQSTRLLKTVSSYSYTATAQIVANSPPTPASHAYESVFHLFETTKLKLYFQGNEDSFLDPDALVFNDLQHRKVIRKATRATFLDSIFGAGTVGFFHFNQGFLDALAPEGSCLLNEGCTTVSGPQDAGTPHLRLPVWSEYC